MTGEQPGDENADDPRSFLSKPRWQRLIIAFAGPFMNVVLAVGLLTGLFMVKYEKLANEDRQRRGRPRDSGFAGGQGRRPGGRRIVRFDGKDNPTWEDISMKEIASAGRTLDVTVERAGKTIETSVDSGAG